MYVFTYRLTVRNPEELATEKKIKRTRSSSPSYFLSCFFGEKTKPPFFNRCTFYISIKIYKRGWFSLLIYFLSVRLLSALHDKNKFKFFSLNFNYFLSVMLHFSLFYFWYCFLQKRGDFPLFIKSNTLPFSLAMLSPGKLLFARWVYCSFFVFPLSCSLSSPCDR